MGNAVYRVDRHQYAQGRVVSTLEGGYDLDALARSVTAHLGLLPDQAMPQA